MKTDLELSMVNLVKKVPIEKRKYIQK